MNSFSNRNKTYAFIRNNDTHKRFNSFSEMDRKGNDNDEISLPSTSQRQLSFFRRIPSDLERFNSIDAPTFSEGEKTHKLFYPSATKKLFSLSSDYMNEEPVHRKTNFTSILPSRSNSSFCRTYFPRDLNQGISDELITDSGSVKDFNLKSSDFYPHNRVRVNSELNVKSRYMSSADIPKRSMLRSRGLHSFDTNLSYNKERYFCNTVPNFESSRSHINDTAFRPSEPNVIYNSSRSSEVQNQDKVTYENDVNNFKRFARPSISRFKKVNSTAPRFLHHNNSVKYYEEAKFGNAFNITHIPRRGLSNFSESRELLSTKNVQVDNQSESVISMVSLKAQVTNLLESLHHSILNIVPNVSLDAVRLEFEKTKEGLENIKEFDCASTIQDLDSASVVSHSSRQVCTTIFPEKVSEIFSDTSVRLRSGKDIVKSLASKIRSDKNTGLLPIEEENKPVFTNTSELLENEKEDSALLFKKPKLFSKKIKKDKSLIKGEQLNMKKVIPSKVTQEVINLKQWYPATESEHLIVKGVNENGSIVQTEPVKTRVSNREVKLINGITCNLIGSPSKYITSIYSKEIFSLLNNGLPKFWKKFLSKILSYQAASAEKSSITKKNKRTPVKSNSMQAQRKIVKTQKFDNASPRFQKKLPIEKPLTIKKMQNKSLMNSSSNSKTCEDLVKTVKGKEKESFSPKQKKSKKASPKKNEKGKLESFTRSGRTVKSTSKFGIVPQKEANSPKSTLKYDEMFKRHQRTKKLSSRKKNSHAEKNEASYSSIKDQNKIKRSPVKRKREDLTEEVRCPEKKKSKSEKPLRISETRKEVQGKSVNKKVNKKNNSVVIERKNYTAKGPVNNKKRLSFKNKINKAKDNESEENINKNSSVFEDLEKNSFDMSLDDIQVPEFANSMSRPQLNRSQLRSLTAETPPLKYCSNNLNLLKGATPVRSPAWYLSQRTPSEVEQFERRRALAHKKKVTVEKTTTVSRVKTVQKDVKTAMKWVTEEEVRSPVCGSKVLKYMLPSRTQMEENDEEE